MNVCPKCGKELPEEYGFCTSCGEEMKKQDAPASEETTEASPEAEVTDTSVSGNADETTTESVPAPTEETAPEGASAPAGEAAAESASAPAGEAAAESASAPTGETTPETASASAEEAAPESTPAPAEVPVQETVSAPAADTAQEAIREQNGWSADTAAKPESEPPKAKKGKGTAVIIGAVAVVAIAAVSAFAVMRSDMFKDPKETVIEAFKSVYDEERVSELDEIFGYTEMYEKARKENSEVGLTLALEDSSMYGMSEFSGSGIEMLVKNDIENKKSSAMVGVKYQGMDLAHADVYVDEQELMLAVPELSSKVFSLNYADDLEGQIKKSPVFSEYLDDMDIDFDAFSEYMEYAYSIDNGEEGAPFDVKALWERYKTGSQAIEDLKAAMTVEKGDKAVRTVDGKEENCRVYTAVIPGESVLQFFRSTSDFFLEDETLKKDILEYMTQVIKLSGSMNPYSYSYYSSEDPETMTDDMYDEAEKSVEELLEELEEILQDDIRMTVYVDGKGRLAALEAETELTADDDIVKAEFTAELKGGKYLTENADVQLTMYDDETEVTITVNKTGSNDGKVLLSELNVEMSVDEEDFGFSYAGSYNKDSKAYELELLFETNDKYASTSKIRVLMEGTVTELEKGVMLATEVDSLRFVVDEDYLELSGSYTLKPLDGEVTVPDGTQMDVLAATETEWQAVFMEVYMKAMEISSKLK